MPRQSVPVDRNELQAAVFETERENGGPFENRSRLFHAVAATIWATDHQFAHSLIGLRFNQYDLSCQTPLGRVTEARKTQAANASPDAEPDADDEPSEVLAMVTHGTDADAGLATDPDHSPSPPATEGFFGPFARRGIAVKTLADLVPAASKSDAINWKLSEAWKEIRTNAGLKIPDWEAIQRRRNVG